MAEAPSKTFFSRTQGAGKVMVLDLGFLGDTVHLLPALWMVRQAYPAAKLHVAVAAHITSLMDCVPWVDRTWGYMRYPRHATLRENLRMVQALRREKFDALINFNSSDRSSWLTWLSGARERLGRVPDQGANWFWRQRFTAVVQYPTGTEPVYSQRCHCLEQAGFPAARPEFRPQITTGQLESTGIARGEAGTYLHLSPFTTADKRELAPEQFVQLVTALSRQFPDKRLVLSCSPTERERAKMAALTARMPIPPGRVYAGELSLAQLAAVIQHSALHFSGDTGTLHLAVMTNTPSISWFFANPGIKNWQPVGCQHRSFIGQAIPTETYLQDINTEALVAAAKSVLTAGRRYRDF